MTSGRESTDAILALLRSLVGQVETKEMMGAVGLFLQGAQFGVISDGRLHYRTDHLNRADYEAFETPDPDAFCPAATIPADLRWRVVPGPVLSDAEMLTAWTRKAWEAALRARKAAPH